MEGKAFMTEKEFAGLLGEKTILEDDGESILIRKNCAKMIHLFLQRKMHEKDEINIKKAEEIKDLFDCRICANHIAQVYLKGIMEIDRNMMLFNAYKEVSEKEATCYVLRTVDKSKRLLL